jgi:hypothetical protein
VTSIRTTPAMRRIAGCFAMLVALVTTAPSGAVDFTPHGTQPFLQSPLERADECIGCHSGSGVERTFMPFSTWGGSMMAHATRDPLFWAALDVANNDVPGVGDYCLRCHTPEGWFGGRVSKDGLGTVTDNTDGCALLGDHDDRDTFKSDFGGVSCHLCHRQRTQGPTGQTARLHNGNLFVGDEIECEDGYTGPCRVGPYQYPDLEAQIGHPPHPVRYSDSVKRSEFCGVCHDVTTPITDVGALKTLILPSGKITAIPFPIERTFTEWKQSTYGDIVFVDGFAPTEPVGGDPVRFGQTCQTCHMRDSTAPETRACQLEDVGSRVGNMPKHEFVGANTWILTLIRDIYGSSLSRFQEINRSITLANEMLTQRSATISVALDPVAAGTLTARVRVTNLAGHKLPTGYGEGRRMWLEAEARDSANAVIWVSGAYDAATGVLTQDAQAKIYEIRQGIWNADDETCDVADAGGDDHFHFVLNDCIAKDNRIPPLGFTGGNDLETRPVPVGYYPQTSPGSGVLVNYDDTTYAIPVPPGTTTPITVTVRLKHQIATKEYIEFLKNQSDEHNFPSEDVMCADNRPSGLDVGPQDKSRGEFMFDLWGANGRSPPVTMATASGASN